MDRLAGVPVYPGVLSNPFTAVLSDDRSHARPANTALFSIIALANVAGWTWALVAFRHYPLLLGTSLLAYGLGLRHGIDADHIAAIDNVTRKLMGQNKRPIAAGFFFSLGHSSVVFLATLAVAATAMALSVRFDAWKTVGSLVGTAVSVIFLLAIAIMNLFILADVRRTFHRVRNGDTELESGVDTMLKSGGLFARIFKPLFRIVDRSWHMYPIGLLFGLGFDTATEVALLGISAAGAGNGLSIWSILVFPALFTAGMTLVDTADSALMVSAYDWSFTRPLRKLYYNFTVTLVSVLVALLVGTIQALGLFQQRLHASGSFWGAVDRLNRNFGVLGYVIVAVFIVTWGVSAVFYRWKGYDRDDDRLRLTVRP